MSINNLILFFVDINKETVKAFEELFKDLYNVKIVRGNIVQIPQADCIVCPGNSYGFMDEGVEKTTDIIFNGISYRVQNVINNIYYGEQPVGTCILLETYHPQYKYLAHLPTCRTSSDISKTSKTNNAYTAFRALLTTILNHNKISDNKIYSIICTGLCTGVGKMESKEAVRQMRIAYNTIDIGMMCTKDNADLITNLLK